jgi:hypothetical protein
VPAVMPSRSLSNPHTVANPQPLAGRDTVARRTLSPRRPRVGGSRDSALLTSVDAGILHSPQSARRMSPPAGSAGWSEGSSTQSQSASHTPATATYLLVPVGFVPELPLSEQPARALRRRVTSTATAVLDPSIVILRRWVIA